MDKVNSSIKTNIHKLKKYIKRNLFDENHLYQLIQSLKFLYFKVHKRNKFGYRDKESFIMSPAHISNTENVYMYKQTRIQAYSKIITYTGKFIMKKYSGVAPGLTVITGNHTPTVGIPHYLLPLVRINDNEKDVIIEEDVWIGANVTLLPGVTIGRGAVVGACSTITKSVPPYAIVVGTPYKIIASKFSLEEILLHEKELYPQEERFSQVYLENLFEKYYKDMSSIGKKMTDSERIQYEDFLKTYNKTIR